ncbi:MAG: AAA family ATPase [Acidobacteria bacterium]|nr:AAA family ATPase [Acidobacteriota bacterium]
MYESFYGLRERPFDLSPNARFLFLSRKHLEALTHLEYALGGRPGLTVLIGEAGTGKTTLIRAALQQAAATTSGVVHLANPTLTRAEFFEFLASGFGFSNEAATSKTRFLRELEAALAAQPATGAGLALVIDEAQAVPHELLEEIRLLSNVDAPSGRTVAVILAGQPELAVRLNDASLRQLKQRVALRCELGTLDLAETASYIAARVKVAGGRAEQIFSREAVATVHQYSGGIPRTISVICDNALVNGFAANARPVGPDLVLEVCRDFQIEPPGAATTAPQAAGSVAEPVHSAGTVIPPSADAVAADGPSDREAAPMFSGYTKPRRFFQFSR